MAVPSFVRVTVIWSWSPVVCTVVCVLILRTPEKDGVAQKNTMEKITQRVGLKQYFPFIRILQLFFTKATALRPCSVPENRRIKQRLRDPEYPLESGFGSQ